MYVVAITGASGPIIGLRLVENLLKSGKDVGVIVSKAAWMNIHYEVFNREEKPASVHETLSLLKSNADLSKLREYDAEDFFSPAASGTGAFKAVIVAPCSMKTLGAIAHGYSDSLVTRAVDVALKEDRQVIVVPRETPLNLIHLENLVKVKRAGVHVVMPVPGFYTFPQTIDDVVNFIVGKILSLIKIDHDYYKPWGEDRASE